MAQATRLTRPLDLVEVPLKRLDDYAKIIGEQKIEEIRQLAAPLKGASVLHLNATAFGGGVAEILITLVPLMQDLGLEAEWRVLEGTDEFFNVTKAFHNALQGAKIELTPAMKEIYRQINELNAKRWPKSFDFNVIHDPQPLAIRSFLREPQGKWIWRFHIDPTNADPAFWAFIKPMIEAYDAAIFTMKEYAKSDLKGPEIAIIPPAIDPLSPKNIPLPRERAEEIVRKYQVDPTRPLMLQVSRFDPWKDPLGVIDAYRLVKEQHPDLQLVLIASMASDDPEGWTWYEKTVRHAGNDWDIHMYSNLNGVGNVEVNAFQVCADVIVQKSTREGFGLVVTEALWKEKPVVGGNVGGIPLQVIDGKTGFLVNNVSECAEKVSFLLEHPEESEAMGKNGREWVREHFITTVNLTNYLKLFLKLAGKSA